MSPEAGDGDEAAGPSGVSKLGSDLGLSGLCSGGAPEGSAGMVDPLWGRLARGSGGAAIGGCVAIGGGVALAASAVGASPVRASSDRPADLDSVEDGPRCTEGSPDAGGPEAGAAACGRCGALAAWELAKRARSCARGVGASGDTPYQCLRPSTWQATRPAFTRAAR